MTKSSCHRNKYRRGNKRASPLEKDGGSARKAARDDII